MYNEDIISDVSKIVDYLDSVLYLLKSFDDNTREQDIAIQKLEEAVFWLSYGLDGGDSDVDR